jgi:hypothetical protein
MRLRTLWICLSLGLLMLALGLLVGSTGAVAPPAVTTLVALASDGGGVAILDPPLLHANQRETFRLIFTCGAGGLPQGSQLQIQDPDFHGMGWTMFQRFQTGDDQASGYLTVTSSNGGVSVSIERFESAGVQDLSFTVVTVDSGSLAEGETVTVTFGDTSGSPDGAALTPHTAYRHVTWLVSTDTDGDQVFQPLAEQPSLDIAPEPDAAHMFATGPTFVQQGFEFDLAVRVLDSWGNACITYGSALSFSSTDGAAALPADTGFAPGDGFHRYPVTLNTPGIHYLYIDDGGSFAINSNPIVVVDSPPEEQILWGDLHGHHGHVYTYTVGISPLIEVRVDEYIDYARDVSDLDFVCESHKSSAYWNVPQVHAEIAESVLLHESRDFVVFRGYEWMGKKGDGEGHHNVYFLAADAPYYSPLEPDSDTLDELYLKVANDGHEALVIPHAPSYSGSNWNRFDADDLNARLRRQAEIYSHWDLSEELDPGSVRAGWVTGNRIGVIASTDGHFNYPGLPIGDVCDESDPGGPTCVGGRTANGGLAAVRAPHLTRQDIWQGLKQRHTYGTDGTRIYLDFTSDGVPMGEEYSTMSAPQIEVVAAGTAQIEMVQVFRGTFAEVPSNPGDTDAYYTTIYTDTPAAMTTSFDLIDSGFSEDCLYYVRVTQTDGRRAWSSPIWVNRALPPSDLWAGCGDGEAGDGENLVTCAEDVQFSQSSQVQVENATPRLLANGVQVPLTGLRVYNVTNVDSYVPYGIPAWLELMQRQVDRVRFAGTHYLSFNAFGISLYDGPEYPTGGEMDNDDNWTWGMLDALFDYAAQQGVYLIPTLNTDKPPSWWQEDHQDAMQTDNEGTIWGIATFNNPSYWTWADALLTRVLARYEDHPALLAWDVRVGEGENNYAPPYTGNVFDPPDSWCDYSLQALTNFRGWLTAKYGTDANLQTAWLSDTVTLATAEIPLPKGNVTPTNESEVLPWVNGPGDTRPNFYDWHLFRLDEKVAETAHFAALFRSLDPDHVLLSDPAYVPLNSGNRLRWGTIDGETHYRSPEIDAVVRHPRIGHTDESGSFNSQRIGLGLTDQYAAHHGTISTWANEETSEILDPGGDQENLWRLGSVAALHAAMGQGGGWVTGSITDTMLPAWSDGERAEMLRLAGLYTAPELRSPQPEIAILADPRGDVFDYHVTGPVAAPLLLGPDRQSFLESLWTHGLAHDILTVDDVRLDADRLTEYAAILMLNQSRLPLDVAQALGDYRDSGGGLFLAGRTGIFDELGNPDTGALETLLGVTLTGLQVTDYEVWSFDSVPDPLLGGLQGIQYDDGNLYYVPVFDLLAEGYTPLAHLDGAPLVVTAGYKDRTVFWFPRLTADDAESLLAFQRNVWSFFGVEPPVTADGQVELSGDNYLSLYSPSSQTVEVGYAPDMSGALVWDWNAMELVGPVPPGPQPQLTVNAGANSTTFLGTFWPDEEPQLVAVSGASLARTAFGNGKFQVAVYRAAPGMQVQVAVHTGGEPVLGTAVSGGGLDHADYDLSGEVYVVQVTPTAERLTITVQVKYAVRLPLALKAE